VKVKIVNTHFGVSNSQAIARASDKCATVVSDVST